MHLHLQKRHRPEGWNNIWTAAYTCDCAECEGDGIVFFRVRTRNVLEILCHEVLHLVFTRIGEEEPQQERYDRFFPCPEEDSSWLGVTGAAR